MAGTESSGPYVKLDWITITTTEMAPAMDVNVARIPKASFVSRLLEIFRVSTINIFLCLVLKTVVEWDRKDPDMELWLMFVKSGFLVEYIFRRHRLLVWKIYSS